MAWWCDLAVALPWQDELHASWTDCNFRSWTKLDRRNIRARTLVIFFTILIMILITICENVEHGLNPMLKAYLCMFLLQWSTARSWTLQLMETWRARKTTSPSIRNATSLVIPDTSSSDPSRSPVWLSPPGVAYRRNVEVRTHYSWILHATNILFHFILCGCLNRSRKKHYWTAHGVLTRIFLLTIILIFLLLYFTLP